MRTIALFLIRAYQFLAPPPVRAACRHVPSCSNYAAEAITRHGTLRCGWLALRRLLRCHPFGTSGYDPVPGRNEPPGHEGRRVHGAATGVRR